MIQKTTLAAFWRRFKRAGRYYARGLYRELSEKDVFLWAQAIAFKVLVTIVPVVLLAAGIIGQVLRSSQPFNRVASFVRDFLPPEQSEQIIRFLSQLYGASGTITLFGAAGLFLSAWSLFITLRVAVSNAFAQNWSETRSIIGGYLFDARMVVQVGLLFTLTIGVSVFTQSLDPALLLKWLGLDYTTWIHQGWQRALRVASFVTPLLISTLMFFQLFYFVPRPHPRKRSALVGSFISAVLWEGAKQGFTFYATYVGGFDRYQSGGEGLAALGNVFGLIIAFVFWVYFSAIVLMIGAVIVSLHEDRIRSRQRAAAASEAPTDTGDNDPPEPVPTAPGVPDASPSDAPPSPEQPHSP